MSLWIKDLTLIVLSSTRQVMIILATRKTPDQYNHLVHDIMSWTWQTWQQMSTQCHTLIFVALVLQSEDNNNNESSSLGIFFAFWIPDTWHSTFSANTCFDSFGSKCSMYSIYFWTSWRWSWPFDFLMVYFLCESSLVFGKLGAIKVKSI